MIDWGAGQCYVILLGEECLHTIGQSRWPMKECKMISRCEEIQNVSLITRINFSGVQEVWPGLRSDVFRGYAN
jgi:hypothetical protein